MLEHPALSDREREVVRMRYIDGLKSRVIAEALGINRSTVESFLTFARKKAAKPVAPTWKPAAKNKPIDAAWEQRQVDYLRSLGDDEEHVARYLRGLAICQGQAIADKIERRIQR